MPAAFKLIVYDKVRSFIMPVLTKPKRGVYVVASREMKNMISSRTAKQEWSSVCNSSKLLKENNSVSFAKYKKGKGIK